MDEPTPSGGTEPSAESAAEDASANAVGEPTDASAEGGTEQEVDAGAEADPTEKSKEEKKEKVISSEDLLKEAEIKLAEPEKPKAEKPDDHRAKEKSKFQGLRDKAIDRIYASEAVRGTKGQDRKVALEEEIGKEPLAMQNHIRKETNRLEGTEDISGETPEEQGTQPTEEDKVKSILAQERDIENFNKLWPEICSTSGLNKDTTFAIEKRKELLAIKDKLVSNEKQPNHTEALELAAAKIGLFDKEKMEKAKQAAAKAVRGAHPPTGEPSRSAKKTEYTEKEFSELPQEEFEKVEKLRMQGKVKIIR
jgi:hypothetical protein